MREIKFRVWDGEKMWMPSDVVIEFHGGSWGFNTLPRTHGDFRQCRLMQYTGLKDKSGCEIYEGDIVLCYDYPPSAVEFFDGSFITQIGDGGWLEMSQNSFKFEVVGNIYENADLLEPVKA